MALPKIKHPTYTVVIPSTKQSVNIRPFTVQEEKLLLMTRSGGGTDDIVKTVKQIISNCIIESINVDKLATFDIEYLFIKLRSKSVGEIVDLEYTVPETEEKIKFKLNLDDVEVKYNDKHVNKFNLTGEIGVVMRYPTLNEVQMIEQSEDPEKTLLDILFKCIDKIYDNDNLYSDFTDEELQEFVDNLPVEAMPKIRDFFETMPSVVHELKLKSKDGKTVDVTIRGLTNFFT
jgi:hypothetical protein